MSYHRLVLAICVCNGEQFLEKTIEDAISKIKDINCIHVFDGAWEQSGYDKINSVDKTEEIMYQINDKYGEEIQIIYQKSDHFFRNPSDKRNEQMHLIGELFEEFTMFWLDDDEEIRFRDGRTEMWLRDTCQDAKVPIIIETYADGSTKSSFTPRLVTMGYHWHSELAMCLHNEKCQQVIDWTPEREKFDPVQLLQIPEMFIVNHWRKRNIETLKKREAFNIHERAEIAREQPCNMRRK